MLVRPPFLMNLVYVLTLSVCASTSLNGQQRAEGSNDNDQVAVAAISIQPEIRPQIHEAMQSRSYADAIKLIQRDLDSEDVKNADYLCYLQGVAHTETRQFDQAVESFRELERRHPASDWLSRARFGRAHVFVLQRQYIKAGEIYSAEAERLLSRGRKDKLAEIYLEFADRYFDGVPADDPSQSKQPDFGQALSFYAEAVKLGPTIPVRQRIEFRIARCHEQLNQHDDAIQTYTSYLADHCGEDPISGHPVSVATEVEAKYRLGSVQLASGQSAQARKTWQDLLGESSAESAATAQTFLSRAEYRLAHTYGLPSPATVGDLELAVTVAEHFLAQHPDDKLAPQAELEIAQGYSLHARHTESVNRLRSLLSNDGYAESRQIPIAQRMLGQELLAQGKYDEAITAWKEFLERHPTDPSWPSIQKRIVDTEYSKAEFARDRKEFKRARELWQIFLNKYPLDSRAPHILLQFGQMKQAQAIQLHADQVASTIEKGGSAQDVTLSEQSKTLLEEAISDWRRVVSKYPGTAQASQSALMIGVVLEDKLDRLPEALESYKNVDGIFAEQAGTRRRRMTAPHLTLVTERKFRTDEQPRIKLITRNLQQVSVKAYRVDMTDYFRKMHLASGIETLDIALIDPDEQFDYDIPEYVDFKQISGDIEIPIHGPGVTAVTVSSDDLEATTMVVVSDLDMIVKTSRNELFLFVEDMLDEKPMEGASVLISDGSKVFAEAVTGDDGILQASYEELKSVKDLRVFAVHEGHVASTVNNLNGLDFAVGLAPKGYLYTDRPAYRGGQLVNIKGMIRWVGQDRFTFQPGERFKLDLYDPRGRMLHSNAVTLNDYGTINSNVLLPDDAAQGNYRVHLHRAGAGDSDQIGDLSFETQFQVTQFKLEPVQLEIDLDKDVYFRGETVKATLSLKYYYGSPLAGETLQYRLAADGETITAKTNEDGVIKAEFETQRFSESQPLQLWVNFADRSISRVQTLFLATRGFAITASSTRDVFIAGESFETLLKVADPAGKPVKTDLQVEVFRRKQIAGYPGEELVSTHQVSTNERDGTGRQTLALDEGGLYSIRATAVDQFGNRVSGQYDIRISGNKDKTRLRVLADRHSYNVGETAKVNLHWREQPTLALVTFEGARILGHRLVRLNRGDNELRINMHDDFAPNVFVSVGIMQRNQFHYALSEFRVARELRITLNPREKQLKPGDDLIVDIEVEDPQGKPVVAELSLAVVQSNLLDLFLDVQGSVNTFFDSQVRRRSVRQGTSCTFSYQPRTRPVSQFLLAEADRRDTLGREVRALAELSRRSSGDVDSEGSDDPFEPSYDTPVTSGRETESLNRLNDGLSMSVSGGMRMRYQALQQAESTVPAPDAFFDAVPQLRYRTEIRAGTEIQVPIPNQAAQQPAGQQEASNANRFEGISGVAQLRNQDGGGRALQQAQQARGTAAQGRGRISSSGSRIFDANTMRQELSKSGKNDYFVNGLTASGQFVGVNNIDSDQLRQLQREEGFQILPNMPRAETAFWDPIIVTDAKGKATATITMPMRSTAWSLRAKGIDQHTLAGQSSADVITKQDVFGELKLPLAFTAGDRAMIPVEIHHSFDDARSLVIKLKATMNNTSITQTKTIEVQGPGVSKSAFELEIGEANEASLLLTIESGNGAADTTSRVIPIRPFGFSVYATSSGTASQSTLAMVEFDAGVNPEGQSLEILVGSSINQSLLENVLGNVPTAFERCGLPSFNPLERSISDVLAGVELLRGFDVTRTGNTPQAQALSSRISSSVAQLVSAQRDDGGWGWTGGTESKSVDVFLSSRAMWALSAARTAGFAVSEGPYRQGKNYLQSAFAASGQGDLERQTILLHAMAVSGCGDFSYANRLYRERLRLSSAGVLHLTLALSAMNHAEMASELIELVRIPTPGNTSDKKNSPWMRDTTELRALFLLALQDVSPDDPKAAATAKALLGSRVGSRWPIEKSNGPAVISLSRWQSQTSRRPEKYTLTVSVNDEEIAQFTVDPSQDGSRRVIVPNEILRAGKPQRIEFALNGRGSFSYSALLTGFVTADKISTSAKNWTVARRYEPAQRMFEGRPVPRGFDVINGSFQSFSNLVTQLPIGDRCEITLLPRRRNTASRNNETYDYLVLTEPLPAGCTVLEGSVQGVFERYEIEPGQITFFIGNRRYPGDIRYTLVGYLPGRFRTRQSILRSFYDPSLFALSAVKSIEVLPSGTPTVDEYRLSPDELYHLGKKEFEHGDFRTAHQHLSELFDDWNLDADKSKNVVHWLFVSSLDQDKHGDAVKYFEVLKEKFPDVEIRFEDILKVAKSYREIGEYERAYLVYRATIEGSFERESQVAGFLNAQGEFIRSVQAMERILRDYPAESYVATATYALAQETYRRASSAAQDEKLKTANITRVHLIDSAIDMLDHFITVWPEDPADDQASFALATALIDLEQFENAIDRCETYVQRYPNSRLLDSYWYMIGYSHFELEHPEEALQMCRKVAETTFPVPETGGTRAADNRWEAIYIMGQIYHSIGNAADAIAQYTQVRERFADAAEAIRFFNQKQIGLDEVTTIAPNEPQEVDLRFRNISEVAIKVYRIDLMKFGLMQRNLDRITAINLAGIKPYHEETVRLGDGKDFRDREKKLSLPLKQEGAYLIVCRGENLYASGLALVSPLELLIQEDADSGRVRVSVKDRQSDSFVGDVHVKVIGSANEDFVSGDTDLRGLFIADDIRGTSTVIALRENDRYAFYRGETPMQGVRSEVSFENAPAAASVDAQQQTQIQPQKSKPSLGKELLRGNLFRQNGIFQEQQRDTYDELLNNDRSGIKSKEAF